ncbi:MAG: hypothetical protein GKR96_01765 [Gammaproteobacteria bacterium]|nr:hypothetical protein [Gammaproteobacteria bacterium]
MSTKDQHELENMKIVLCMRNDLPSNKCLNEMLPQLCEHDVYVVLSDIFLESEKGTPSARDARFYERDLVVDHFFPLLDKLDVDAPLRTFKKLEKDFENVEIRILGHINGNQAYEYLNSINPDVIVSCRYDHIFTQRIIDIPQYGVINAHSGELPAYQGMHAPFRMIMNGEENVACTLHYVDTGIDTGDIIDIAYVKVDKSKSLFWHKDRIYSVGIPLIVDFLNKTARQEAIVSTPQDSNKATYYTLPPEELFQEFVSRGYKIIDVTEYADTLSQYGIPE